MPKYLIQYSIEEIILLESALKGKLAEIKEIIISAKKKKEYFTADYYEGKAQMIQSMIAKAQIAEAI